MCNHSICCNKIFEIYPTSEEYLKLQAEMSKDEKSKKKPGFMKRLFSSKKMTIDEDQKENKDAKKLQRMNTVDPASLSKERSEKTDSKPKSKDDSEIGTKNGEAKVKAKPDPPARSKSNGSSASARPKEPRKPKAHKDTGKAKRKRKKKDTPVNVDISKELSFPCTPEVLLEYHKNKPILNSSEEWLLVELNEYECLLDSMSIVKIIGKASKFFEVEPDELWEEFFEWVDDIPAYDEVINYDIWQEFRDKKYPM